MLHHADQRSIAEASHLTSPEAHPRLAVRPPSSLDGELSEAPREKGGPRILFITATRIGDVVLSSGLVRSLLAQQAEARLTIAGGHKAIGLFADTPGLERLIPLVKQRRGGHWFDLWRQTRSTRWDQIVDLRGSLSSYALRTPRRRVLNRDRHGASEHKVIQNARLLAAEHLPPAPGLWTSEATERRAAAFLNQSGHVLALAPAANWLGKTWPAERFAQLAKTLTAPLGALPGARVLLLGGEEDKAAAHVVARTLPPGQCILALGEPDLLTTYAMLKHVDLFVGNDSGMMHLAAAAGAPTLGLFGPTDDRLYAPWGKHCAVVRGPEAFEDFKARDPELNQPIPHMESLAVEAVLEAAEQLLTRSREVTS